MSLVVWPCCGASWPIEAYPLHRCSCCMQQVSHRTNVLRAYRQLLQLIKRLPPSQQGKAVTQARSEAANDRNISNAVEASDKLKQLCARIGYLRTITPRQPGDAERLGSGHYVLRDGELVPSDARPESR